MDAVATLEEADDTAVVVAVVAAASANDYSVSHSHSSHRERFVRPEVWKVVRHSIEDCTDHPGVVVRAAGGQLPQSTMPNSPLDLVEVEEVQGVKVVVEG